MAIGLAVRADFCAQDKFVAYLLNTCKDATDCSLDKDGSCRLQHRRILFMPSTYGTAYIYYIYNNYIVIYYITL